MLRHGAHRRIVEIVVLVATLRQQQRVEQQFPAGLGETVLRVRRELPPLRELPPRKNRSLSDTRAETPRHPRSTMIGGTRSVSPPARASPTCGETGKRKRSSIGEDLRGGRESRGECRLRRPRRRECRRSVCCCVGGREQRYIVFRRLAASAGVRTTHQLSAENRPLRPLMKATWYFWTPQSFSTACFLLAMSMNPYCSSTVEMIFLERRATLLRQRGSDGGAATCAAAATASSADDTTGEPPPTDTAFPRPSLISFA